MVATKTCFSLWLLCLVFVISSQAQNCGNCKEVPKIAQFDFDVQVPQPNATDGTENLWPEWKNLFQLAAMVSTHISNNEGNCIKFTKPPSVDTGDAQLSAVGGETFTNLPSNPNISSDLSVYGSYLLTGYIKKQGGTCVLHVEVQSSCNRKTVATSDITFQLSSMAGNASNLAQQVAAQLSPLADKIKNFELGERQKNKSLSLYQTSWGDPIKITPQKKTLKAGETTVFTIELKDCDGVPLEGREILFTETSFEGLKVYGTMGGVVTPAKVITDANGRAKATFTLKSGAKEAVINAHSPGFEVKGCKSMFIGDASINIKRTYSGNVKYSLDQADACETKNQSGSTTSHSMWNNVFKVDYTASFYSNGQDISSENDSNPGNAVPDLMEGGNIIYNVKDYKNIKVTNNPPTIQLILKNQNGGLKNSSIRFSFDNDFQFAELNLKFLLEGMAVFKQTHLPTANNPVNEEYLHSVAFFNSDNNFKYQKTTKGGVITHIITYLRVQNQKCTQIVERLQLQVIEE